VTEIDRLAIDVIDRLKNGLFFDVRHRTDGHHTTESPRT
jgi:hypothetical protein